MPKTKRGRPKKKVVVLNEDNVLSVLNQMQRAEGLAETKLPYFISLAFGAQVYEGSGATVLDALQAMPIPIKIVSKGLLKLTDGTKKFEQTWQPVRLKRLFQPLSQAVQSKMLTLLMR